MRKYFFSFLLIFIFCISQQLVESQQLESQSQQEDIISFLQNGIDKTASLPIAAKCFLWLVGVTVGVTLCLHLLERLKYFEIYNEGIENNIPISIKQILTPSTLMKGKHALSLIPIISIIMLFLLFRAKTQLIPEDNSDYLTLLISMQLTTFGIIILALNAMSIRVESVIFGNISDFIGKIMLIIGYSILIWALFEVRSQKYKVEVTEKCFISVSILILICEVIVTSVQIIQRVFEINFESINEIMNEIDTGASFSTLFMIPLFYIHFFPWSSKATLPDITNILLILVTIAVFIQTIRAFIPNPIHSFVTVIAPLFFYSCLAVVIYCITTVAPPSIAILNVEILMGSIALLELISYALEESNGKESKSEQSEKLCQTIRSLFGAKQRAYIISILLLYIHFYSELILKEHPENHIKNIWYLPFIIYFTTFCLFLNMFCLIVEFFVEENSLTNFAIGFAISGVHVGLACLVLACL
eukprot:c13896_g1_i1.p1 GENE.c13896_g1_i1~~c13896_g1_i1.p1  ORF type:complete len:486 (+),score=127.57 c13896_g1_i1:41-1459(+)